MTCGYKQITPENWLEMDEALKPYVYTDENGSSHHASSELYRESILSFAVNQKAPDKVKNLFEVARGSMVYGYFYYPLFTLASEQLFRVLETVTYYKCQELGASKNQTKRFQDKIRWLHENGHISEKTKGRFDNCRSLRNTFSHPKGQTILPPSYALANLNTVCELIDELYKDS